MGVLNLNLKEKKLPPNLNPEANPEKNPEANPEKNQVKNQVRNPEKQPHPEKLLNLDQLFLNHQVYLKILDLLANEIIQKNIIFSEKALSIHIYIMSFMLSLKI